MTLSKIKKEEWKYDGDIKSQFKEIFGDYVIKVSEESFGVLSVPETNISIKEKKGLRLPELDEPNPKGRLYSTIENSILELKYSENVSKENLNEIRGLIKKIKC